MKRAVFLFAALVALFCGCGFISQDRVPFEEKPGAPETTPIYNYDGWVIARGVVHAHTTYSDGCRSPEDLARMARAEGLAVLAINDHREGEICVGEGRGLCVDMGGLDTGKKGYRKYFAELGRLAAESESPLIITGLEVGPYFFNTGVAPNFTFTAAHWHFTTYEIGDPAVYEQMPVRSKIMPHREPYPGLKPYLEWVDYIINHGGMVFQAHPEGDDYEKYYTAMLLADAPTHLTDKIPNLTGVAVVPGGMSQVAQPGGEWDRAQFQYLAGLRKAPLWGIGDSDYHCLPGPLRYGTTLFYVKELAGADILAAMKTGKMVALMGRDLDDVYVTEFSAGDGKAAEKKIMFGESAVFSSPAVIRFSLNKPAPEQTVKLVRSGKVVLESKASSFEYRDAEAASAKVPVFYRVMIIGRGSNERWGGNWLFTNPIFVDWKK